MASLRCGYRWGETKVSLQACGSHSPHLLTYIAFVSRIRTYINNLHPITQSQLYTIIEEVIAAAIPLWELTLSLAHDASLYDAPRRIQYHECSYHDGGGDDDDEDEDDPYPEWEGDEEDGAFEARVYAWNKRRCERRRVVLPEPPREFDPGPLEVDTFSLKEMVGASPLQVIVKLANIELTPEKPQYGGGTWHVEGMSVSCLSAPASPARVS